MAPSADTCFWPPHSAWLYKARKGDAWGKWLQPCRRRYFTVDFEQQILFYSKREGGQGVSEPIPFADIFCAVSCRVDDESMTKAISISSAPSYRRSLCNLFSSQRSYFTLRTSQRTFQLAAETDEQADVWVDMLNAAHRMGKLNSSLTCAEFHGGDRFTVETTARRRFDESITIAPCHTSQRAVISVIRAPDHHLDLDCDLSETVQQVKLKLQDTEGFELDQQCIDFNGRRMQDEKTLSSYGIQSGAVLHLFLRVYTKIEKRWAELLDRLLVADSKRRSEDSHSGIKVRARQKNLQQGRASFVLDSNRRCPVEPPTKLDAQGQDDRLELHGQSSDSASVDIYDIDREGPSDAYSAGPETTKRREHVPSTRRRASKLPETQGQDDRLELHGQSSDSASVDIYDIDRADPSDAYLAECKQINNNSAGPETTKRRERVPSTRRRASKLPEFKRRRSLATVSSP